MPLDPTDRAVLRDIARVCDTEGVDWMLIGALARDVQLDHVAGISTLRATNDVDIAVMVPSWGALSRLTDRLVRDAKFATTRSLHRMAGHLDGPYVGRQLDIVPFGPAITGEEHVITWPGDLGIVMSVAGFDEAFSTSVLVQLDTVEIRVPSVPGIAMLKLLAWRERHHETTKDAVDFGRILATYQHVIGPDRLYGQHLDILEGHGYDNQRAAAFLLGRDIATVATPSTKTTLVEVLADADARLAGDLGDERAVDLLAPCLDGLST